MLTLAAYPPLPLAGGGEVVWIETGHEVLAGPEGRLPDVPRFGPVALRWSDGTLSAEPVADDLVPDPAELLYHPLQRQLDEHHWRDFATSTTGATSRPPARRSR